MQTNTALPRSAPEAQGVSSAAVLAFLDAIERGEHAVHSLMLVRHGQVLAEGWWRPYGVEHPHMLYSLSKSFTATAIGLAVAEGRLSLDDLVLSFFPDKRPEQVGQHLAAMQVRHLLSMSTGHAEDTIAPLRERADGDWVKGWLALPVQHPPGTHFVYNSGASYMLSAIVQQLTGTTTLDYLRPRLLDPLGIDKASWESCPRGINLGGWGMSITTESIARFGLLYLQRGAWGGRRILSEAWVADASAPQIANGSNPNSDWEQGYGYQFWRCRHDAYRGDGAFGQFCVIMPEQDAVLAVTSGLEDMQALLDLVWQHLLPAFAAAPLPADETAREALGRRLAGLAIPPQTGPASSPQAAHISGRTYAFAPNDQQFRSVRFDLDPEPAITIENAHGTFQFACGPGEWHLGTLAVDQRGPQRVAASGAWADNTTYAVRMCFYETPFCPTIICRFVGDELLFDFTANVAFGPKAWPRLVGRAEPSVL